MDGELCGPPRRRSASSCGEAARRSLGGGASRPRAALAEGGGTGEQPGAAAEAGRRRRGTLPLESPAEMLAENLVEEFEMKEDEPWYDHRDLQQGEGEVAPRVGERPGGGHCWCETVRKLPSLAVGDADAGKVSRSPGGGARPSRPQEASAPGPRPC